MENHACRESRSVTSVRPTPGRTPARTRESALSGGRTPARPCRATRERRYRRAARARATRATSRSHVAVVDRGAGTERPRRRPGRAFVNVKTRLDPLGAGIPGGAWGHAPCEFPCPHAVRVDTQRRFPPRTRNTRRRDAGVTTRTGTARRHGTIHRTRQYRTDMAVRTYIRKMTRTRGYWMYYVMPCITMGAEAASDFRSSARGVRASRHARHARLRGAGPSGADRSRVSRGRLHARPQ